MLVLDSVDSISWIDSVVFQIQMQYLAKRMTVL